MRDPCTTAPTCCFSSEARWPRYCLTLSHLLPFFHPSPERSPIMLNSCGFFVYSPQCECPPPPHPHSSPTRLFSAAVVRGDALELAALPHSFFFSFLLLFFRFWCCFSWLLHRPGWTVCLYDAEPSAWKRTLSIGDDIEKKEICADRAK